MDSIRGPKANELSAERKVALQELMKAFTRDWGIAFDVEIAVAAFDPGARSSASAGFESRPLVACFTPRNFFVHNGRRLSSVMTNPLFLGIAKPLYQAVAADLKARCIEAFAIKDPVDVKIQQGLKDDIACVVRTDLEGVEALAQVILAGFRKSGLKLAARFWEHYLGASGSSIEVGREEAFEFDLIRKAVQENIERFKQRNFIAPESSTPGSSVVEDIAKNPKTRVAQFQDHWEVDLNLTSVSGIVRFATAGFSDFTDTVSAFLGTGASSVTSSGDFLLQRQGDRILVTGTITHLWTDPGFNFNPGQEFHPESQILERHGKARPFQWKAEWRDIVEGMLQIDNAFQSNAALRWVSFETRPGP